MPPSVGIERRCAWEVLGEGEWSISTRHRGEAEDHQQDVQQLQQDSQVLLKFHYYQRWFI